MLKQYILVVFVDRIIFSLEKQAAMYFSLLCKGVNTLIELPTLSYNKAFPFSVITHITL
jgi:hypothetical protein